MRSDALKKAQDVYESKCRKLCLRFRLEGDEDILNWIDHQMSANDSIKKLIRAEIKRKKK